MQFSIALEWTLMVKMRKTTLRYVEDMKKSWVFKASARFQVKSLFGTDVPRGLTHLGQPQPLPSSCYKRVTLNPSKPSAAKVLLRVEKLHLLCLPSRKKQKIPTNTYEEHLKHTWKCSAHPLTPTRVTMAGWTPWFEQSCQCTPGPA